MQIYKVIGLILSFFFGVPSAPAQSTYPYVLKTVAGSFPLGDGGPATSALLYVPFKTVPDAQGNLYVLDQGNRKIRKIARDGIISTAMNVDAVYDMALTTSGLVYFIGTDRRIYKAALGGTPTPIAGVQYQFGFSGDGGPALNAYLSDVEYLAVDTRGNLFFIDKYRLRKVSPDGIIQTVAGNSDAGDSGDGGPAVNALLNGPRGLAIDDANNVYVGSGCTIRKIDSAGVITTFAGGKCGSSVDGPALSSPLGGIFALAVDAQHNVYASEASRICKISLSGQLVNIAGTGQQYGSRADGPALSTSLAYVTGLAADNSGNLFITDQTAQQVRKLTGGTITTIAGRPHDDGDGTPATQAVLDVPVDVAFDAAGSMFISDSYNQKIRKVTRDGIISTFAGTGVPDFGPEGASIPNFPITNASNLAIDASGAVYFVEANIRVRKIGVDGIVRTVAGMRATGDSGDGGSATAAKFMHIAGLALDAQGNMFIADAGANRVRKISAATGTITAWAGDGKRGSVLQGVAATSAHLSLINGFAAPLAVDSAGNLYISDTSNNLIRMVTPAGIISTVIGNGLSGNDPQEGPALSTALPFLTSLTFDSANHLYFGALNVHDLWEVISGSIHRLTIIDANGNSLLPDSTTGAGMTVVGSDIYVVNENGPTVEKLILNSPLTIEIVDGDNQAGLVGTALANPLRVRVNGRGGRPTAGTTVLFAVTSGSATVAFGAQADNLGIVSVPVTLGSSPGNIVITATVSDANIPAVRFNAAARAPGDPCRIGLPSITSLKSLTAFGGQSSFSSGSWLEVKGSNLATNTRQWTSDDFVNNIAPTALDGTAVSVNGNAGFVEYISTSQINIQAPDDPSLGPVPISVTTCAGSSSPVTINKVTIAPGMLAPDNFNVGGKQYMVALFPDGLTFVGKPGLLAGASFRPASPGDTIIAYGIGFGSVSPPTQAGTIPQQSTTLAGLTIAFGGISAATQYAGLAFASIGLFQFNIIVPDLPSGDYPINISVSGVPVEQNLFLTVQK